MIGNPGVGGRPFQNVLQSLGELGELGEGDRLGKIAEPNKVFGIANKYQSFGGLSAGKGGFELAAALLQAYNIRQRRIYRLAPSTKETAIRTIKVRIIG